MIWGDALSHNGHDGQQQQQSRKSHPGIDKALHRQVQFTAKESRSDADQDRDANIEHGRSQTDKYGDTSPEDQAAEQVSSHVVGTQRYWDDGPPSRSTRCISL